MAKEAAKRIHASTALRGKTFAIFTGVGMRVDLKRYFASEAGKDARISIAKSAATHSPNAKARSVSKKPQR